MTTVRVNVSGARGESLVDTARRIGAYGVTAGDSDEVVLEKVAQYLIDENPGFKGDKGDPGSPGEGYATRAALATAGDTATALDDAYLAEAGYEGKFVFSDADLSAEVSADVLDSTYIPPAGDTTGASGAWVRNLDAALRGSLPGYRGPQSLGQIVARMALGEAVAFACYGDSQTDGNNTTDWVANTTDGSGNASGGDHNPDAPNAWPAKLQTALRDMFANSSIIVNNAGYSGKKLSDGWAVSNYEDAVTGSYGDHDAVFVAFGTNDQSDAGAVADHLAQSRLLIRKIIASGALPILLTDDPNFHDEDAGDVADGSRLIREIEPLKAVLAEEFGIPLMPAGDALTDWMANNEDDYPWYPNQDDGAHGGDRWHAFKAAWIAAGLFPATVWIDGVSPRSLLNLDPRTDFVGSKDAIYSLDHPRVNRQGGIPLAGAYFTPDEPVTTIWVFNRGRQPSLLYRLSSNGGVTTRADSETVTVREYVDDSDVFTGAPDNNGYSVNTAYHASDRPSVLCSLKHGLNKVTITAPPSSNINYFYGYFEVRPRYMAGIKPSAGWYGHLSGVNALQKTGSIYRQAFGTSGKTMMLSGEADDGSNVMCFGRDGGLTSLMLEVLIEKGSGFTILSGKGYKSGVGATAYKRVAVVIYRLGDLLIPYLFSWTTAGVFATTGALWGAAGAAWAHSDAQKLRIDLSRNTGTGKQRMVLYGNWDGSGSALLDISGGDSTNMIPAAGYFGDAYSNSPDFSGSSSLLDIQRAVIRHA